MLPDSARHLSARPSAPPDVEPDPFRWISVTVEGRPPTPNARPGNWQADRRKRDEWKGIAQATARAEVMRWELRRGLRWRTLDRCTLQVTFYVPTHAARDWDNLIAGIKPLLDGIVAAKVITDDSDRVIFDVSFAVRYEKGRSATEFEISEVEG